MKNIHSSGLYSIKSKSCFSELKQLLLYISNGLKLMQNYIQYLIIHSITYYPLLMFSLLLQHIHFLIRLDQHPSVTGKLHLELFSASSSDQAFKRNIGFKVRAEVS